MAGSPITRERKALERDFYSVGCATVLLSVPRLASRLGVDVTFATETFQRTGSFKFRAAYAVAAAVPESETITSSSGKLRPSHGVCVPATGQAVHHRYA